MKLSYDDRTIIPRLCFDMKNSFIQFQLWTKGFKNMLASHIIEVSCHDIEKASELTGLAASSRIEKGDSEFYK